MITIQAPMWGIFVLLLMLVLFLLWVCYVRAPFTRALEWLRAREAGQGQADQGEEEAEQVEGPEGPLPGQLALEFGGGQIVPQEEDY